MLLTGWEHHQAGRLRQAEEIYRQILESSPEHADAWGLLGAAAYAQGRLQDAVEYLHHALRLRPDWAEVRANLASVQADLGQLDAAARELEQVCRERPDFAVAHFNLGNVRRQQDRFAEAIAFYEQALRLRPDYVEALHNYGFALHQQGRTGEAIARFQQVLRLQPARHATHNNLGICLAIQGRLSEAAAHYRQALELQPDYADATANLAYVLADVGQLDEAERLASQALRQQPQDARAHDCRGYVLARRGRLDEAATWHQEALRLDPRFVEARNNLGNALLDNDKPEQAEPHFREAVRVKPNFAVAYNNLAGALMAQGKWQEAQACYERAVALDRDFAPAHKNLGWMRILRGDDEHGWPEYEWRLGTKEFPLRRCPQPYWDGLSLAGRAILLHSEQGLGDTLQFIRYVPLVKAQGARVIVEVPKALVPLCRTMAGIDDLVACGQPLPEFDVHCSLMSLPALLRTRSDAIPANVPYLFADPELVKQWREKLGGAGEYKIGVAWQGNPQPLWDRQRSFPLACLEPVAKVPGVRLYSLQKKHGVDQVAKLADRFTVTDLGSTLDENTGAFIETAAVMMNLDLVITCDSAIGHLAGALAVPFWLANSFVPNFRWLLDRTDSPWYPTARLFRQKRRGEWGPVFEEMARVLSERLSHNEKDQECH
jgi:tetratricopeptide (TPR) repeat protein